MNTPSTSVLVVFSHGKESGPWGSKIKALSDVAKAAGHRVESIDYTDLPDPNQRVERLLTTQLPPHERLILVGSSMGGYVSTVAAKTLKPSGLFLLAPAFYLPTYDSQDLSPGEAMTTVVFGWNDSVVPVENGIRFAKTYRTSLHVLDADHRLNTVLTGLCKLFADFLHAEKSRQPISPD